jgi:large subunit ribosomal protein L4
MQVPLYNLKGQEVGKVDISDSVFAVPFNRDLVHQAVLRQQANARQGTASTKTRGEVNGSTKKLYHQKGTGNARAGSRKTPTRKGGGVVFGPHPRDYRQAMPKKMAQQALRCVLSAKVADGELRVVESLKFEEPRTRIMAGVLDAFKLETSALVVSSESQGNLIKSARNLPGIKTMPANILNVVDILGYRALLMEVDAVRKAEQLWGKTTAGEETNANA